MLLLRLLNVAAAAAAIISVAEAAVIKYSKLYTPAVAIRGNNTFIYRKERKVDK